MDYFLTTPRLGFRCWSEEDLPLATELWADPAVTGLFGGPYTPEMVRARLDREMAQMRDSGVQYWPVFLLRDGRHAGCAGLRWRDRERRIYELGYHLRPAFWGQGLATEASRALIDYAFSQLGALALFAGHHPKNERSRRVLLKLGFEYAGDERFPDTGGIEPTYLLGRSSWSPGANA
jgi:[ribosomal protein S5]-alanine N-acetyltransferase